MRKLCRALYIDFNPDYTTRIHEDCLIMEDRGLIIESVNLARKPAREYLERHLPITSINFNTGRGYTENGQRINSWMVGGSIYFHDLDRGIAGRLRGEFTTISKELVMMRYDQGIYEEILL